MVYLITDVQSKHDGQHASRGVSAMVLGPAVMSVLKEAWVHHNHLQTHPHITKTHMYLEEQKCCSGNVITSHILHHCGI